MDLNAAMRIASAGMRTQSARLRVVSENIANAESTGTTPGADAYRRKTVIFGQALDRELGTKLVTISRYDTDKSDEPMRLDPGNPAADADGYVKMPNVNSLVELMDMREAQRSYEANLNAQSMARSMLEKTISLLKS
ncbi:flagellar basal-body rod protein FlgC [Arboricoccus pini]|uniref:Flagellar basal-body rod protein FlgC n=1 Tax=Arboricoccus pini TaxID=1963835 RepID=A0A212QUW9_9PROT|nr:flagellar basal body rod protein FlgC [Arboricoccus pini]SNB63480.1 flagellar basal-body rod protein FlgC [Arboricoccus pini]